MTGMQPATSLPPWTCPGCGRSLRLPRAAFAEWWFTTPSQPFETLIQMYARLNLCRCGR